MARRSKMGLHCQHVLTNTFNSTNCDRVRQKWAQENKAEQGIPYCATQFSVRATHCWKRAWINDSESAWSLLLRTTHWIRRLTMFAKSNLALDTCLQLSIWILFPGMQRSRSLHQNGTLTELRACCNWWGLNDFCKNHVFWLSHRNHAVTKLEKQCSCVQSTMHRNITERLVETVICSQFTAAITMSTLW